MNFKGTLVAVGLLVSLFLLSFVWNRVQPNGAADSQVDSAAELTTAISSTSPIEAVQEHSTRTTDAVRPAQLSETEPGPEDRLLAMVAQGLAAPVGSASHDLEASLLPQASAVLDTLLENQTPAEAQATLLGLAPQIGLSSNVALGILDQISERLAALWKSDDHLLLMARDRYLTSTVPEEWVSLTTAFVYANLRGDNKLLQDVEYDMYSTLLAAGEHPQVYSTLLAHIPRSFNFELSRMAIREVFERSDPRQVRNTEFSAYLGGISSLLGYEEHARKLLREHPEIAAKQGIDPSFLDDRIAFTSDLLNLAGRPDLSPNSRYQVAKALHQIDRTRLADLRGLPCFASDPVLLTLLDNLESQVSTP